MGEGAIGEGVVPVPVPEPFVHRLRVRYAECDLQGIVFNAHYLAYVDHSLTELWRAAFGGYTKMTDRGVDVIVAESHLRFHASAHFDEEVDVAVSIVHLGTTSMIISNRISRAADRVLLADVEMRYVWIAVASGTQPAASGTPVKTPIPEWAREGLAPFTVLEPGAAHDDRTGAAAP
jgi:acyl-CoA thioester hydrolase